MGDKRPTHRIRLASLLALAVTALTLATQPVRANEPAGPRWIVELTAPPLAHRPPELAGKAGNARPAPPARLDAESPASIAYLSLLAARQDRVAAAITTAIPASRVERRYGVLLNALAVQAPSAAALAAIPGVKSVAPDAAYRLTDFPDVEQLNAPFLWEQVGGPSKAGAGVKIAIIDSGIYLPNPSFSGAGYSYPAGFPKGDTRATNEKVIAARAYYRQGDPSVKGTVTPLPEPDESGHGTHVAATAGGNYGVLADSEGVKVAVSGVAPGAYLMNYRVFYTSQSPSDFVRENAFTIELIAALEDAVRDGADVINNSWGASYSATYGWPDPMVKAIEAAISAGVVVVHAAGNEGPMYATTNNPTNAPNAISVGAVTTSSEIARDVVVVNGSPEGTSRLRFNRAAFGPRIGGPTGESPAGVVDGLGPNGGCSPLEEGSLTGKFALISRGVCSFAEKTTNAQAAGATAVLFVNDSDNLFQPGADPTRRDIQIPAVMIGRSDGQALAGWIVSSPALRVQLDPRAGVAATAPDRIAQFSSRGPTSDFLLKPDVVAPGVNILAAGYGPKPNPLAGFGQISGTSMAAPHVAGSVALLRQAHPDWTPAQIRNAVMTSAAPTVKDREGRLLGPLERGAGRVDLARATNPLLLADPPSVAFGTIGPGSETGQTIKLTGIAPPAAYTAAIERTSSLTGTAELTVTPAEFTLSAGGAVDLKVRAVAGPATEAGDHQADLVLTGPGGSARIPLWVRVTPERDRGVLLLDNDGSEGLGLPNTAAIYRKALEALQIPYDMLDIDELRSRGDQAFPAVSALQRYRAVILFTGARGAPAAENQRPALSQNDQNILADYLNGGGRVLAAGQSFPEAIDVNFAFEDPLFGRTRLFHGYFGAVSRSQVPAPRELQGASGSPVAGKTIRLATAAALSTVEAYTEDSDTYMAPGTVQPLFGNSRLGLLRASDPTPGEARRQFAYRTALLAFGLDQVEEQDRAALLGPLINWLTAEH